MKKPIMQFETLGGHTFELEYGHSTSHLHKEGKIGVNITYGRGGMIITPKDVKRLIKFFTTCDSLFEIDNSSEICNKRKEGDRWYNDNEMEGE